MLVVLKNLSLDFRAGEVCLQVQVITKMSFNLLHCCPFYYLMSSITNDYSTVVRTSCYVTQTWESNIRSWPVPEWRDVHGITKALIAKATKPLLRCIFEFWWSASSAERSCNPFTLLPSLSCPFQSIPCLISYFWWTVHPLFLYFPLHSQTLDFVFPFDYLSSTHTMLSPHILSAICSSHFSSYFLLLTGLQARVKSTICSSLGTYLVLCLGHLSVDDCG